MGKAPYRYPICHIRKKMVLYIDGNTVEIRMVFPRLGTIVLSRTSSILLKPDWVAKPKERAPMKVLWFFTVFAFNALVTTTELAAQSNQPTPELHRLGQALYKDNCAICHGENGAGDGVLAGEFSPRPRDFTFGTFRFISTPNGSPPARKDIVRTIKQGIEGSDGRSMPAFEEFSLSELLALAEVVRQFAGLEKYGQSVVVHPYTEPFDMKKSTQAYERLGCSTCHGVNGDGNGPNANLLEDEAGNPIKPANFTLGKFKGGNTLEDIWLRIHNGVPGTPMPSFGQNADLSEIWLVTMMVATFSSNQR